MGKSDLQQTLQCLISQSQRRVASSNFRGPRVILFRGLSLAGAPVGVMVGFSTYREAPSAFSFWEEGNPFCAALTSHSPPMCSEWAVFCSFLILSVSFVFPSVKLIIFFFYLFFLAPSINNCPRRRPKLAGISSAPWSDGLD